MSPLGKRVRTLRDNAGLSVRDLAQRVGKTPGYISRIEARGEIPSAELLCELAPHLNVEPEELLDLSKESQLHETAAAIEAKQRLALNLYRKGKR